jgi:hypothetical protein
MRLRFEMRIYAYVVMPEDVHLLVSEPAAETLADAMHFLKLSFTKRLRGPSDLISPTTVLPLTKSQVSQKRRDLGHPALDRGEKQVPPPASQFASQINWFGRDDRVFLVFTKISLRLRC